MAGRGDGRALVDDTEMYTVVVRDRARRVIYRLRIEARDEMHARLRVVAVAERHWPGTIVDVCGRCERNAA